jgi:hypothetical protein
MLSEVLTQAEVELEQGTRVSTSRVPSEQQQSEDARVDVGLLSAISEQEAASNRTWNKERQTKESGSAYAAAACFACDIAPLIILGISAVWCPSSRHSLECLHAHRSMRDSHHFLDAFVGLFLCPSADPGQPLRFSQECRHPGHFRTADLHFCSLPLPLHRRQQAHLHPLDRNSHSPDFICGTEPCHSLSFLQRSLSQILVQFHI